MTKHLTLALLLTACGSPPVTAPTDESSPSFERTAPLPTPPSPAPAPAPAPGPTPSSTKTVLLIPGTMITADYFDTMFDRLKRDGWSPVIYEDPGLLTGSLATGAAGIAQAVDATLAKTGESKLHVIAQCDGGVATRYWLQVLGGHPKVDQVITFVSAHNGTWESPIGSWVTGMQALVDITPGSPFMQKLNGAPFPPTLKLTSIYSCWDLLMIPNNTSVVAGATNVLFCDHKVDHFEPFWDQLVYDRMVIALKGQTGPLRY
jgi:triacylglycerol lipase